jgi:hypothetical protein
MNNANVDLVLMVGDIHSGKQFCTEADPIANLELVRSIFFANPGLSLGHPAKPVISQAFSVDSTHPTDAKYVENVLLEHKGVLFVTSNLPGGSNNDADNWYGVPMPTDAQSTEIAERTAADLRWLDAAFARATADRVRAVVIQLQADMWDRDTKAVSHIANYTTFVEKIASHTTEFGRPVLLLNGDSHSYRSDNPLKAKQACVFESGAASVSCDSLPEPGDGSYTRDAWDNHPGYDVSNFHRLIPHGSTHTATDGSRPPMEWIKLTGAAPSLTCARRMPHPTWTAPVIFGCNEQKYLYVPGRSNRYEN